MEYIIISKGMIKKNKMKRKNIMKRNRKGAKQIFNAYTRIYTCVCVCVCMKKYIKMLVI